MRFATATNSIVIPAGRVSATVASFIMKMDAFWIFQATSIFIDYQNDFIGYLVKAGFTTEAQGGEAATQSDYLGAKTPRPQSSEKMASIVCKLT
jgi:hypothetical protein